MSSPLPPFFSDTSINVAEISLKRIVEQKVTLSFGPSIVHSQDSATKLSLCGVRLHGMKAHHQLNCIPRIHFTNIWYAFYLCSLRCV